MSELMKLRNLIEQLGFKIVNGHWDSYGLILKLVSYRDSKKVFIERSNPEYEEIRHYILSKLEEH